MKHLTYPRLLLGGVERSSGGVGFVEGDASITLEAHFEQSVRLANGLLALGLSKGDRVAIVASSGWRYANVLHATLIAGLVPVPLNPKLADVELITILVDAEPIVVFVDAGTEATLDRLRHAVPSIRYLPALDGTTSDEPSFDSLVAVGASSLPALPDEDDASLMLYTGGTTGRPKGVVHTNRTLVMCLFNYNFLTSAFQAPGVILHAGPMYHIAGAFPVLAFSAAGNSGVFRPAFDPGTAIRDIPTYGVTQLAMVLKLLQMLLDHPDFTPEALESVRCISYGAAAIPATFMARLLESLPWVRIVQSYGMTEAGGITSLTHEDHRCGGIRLQSVGRALPGTMLKIVDSRGETASSGQNGEICIQGGSVLREYWRSPAETADSLRDDWFHTGDAGHLDENGYLFLVDRIKDMIKSGGENVYSAEVEVVLADFPGVEQVAVIGVPSEEWGELVHALIVTRPGFVLDVDALRSYARTRLANFKVPKTFEIRTEPLPVSAGMKVLKHVLRQQHAAPDRSARAE